MSIQRDHWTGSFDFGDGLPWMCPSCGSARLKLKDAACHEGESRSSKGQHGHDAWEPDWIDGRFACLLICPHCAGESGLTGCYTVRDERGYAAGEEVGGYVHYYQPEYFTDAPHVFDLPSSIPNSVHIEIEKSFSLYWADQLACANRIRTAIEALLTAQKINRSTGRPKAGKTRRRLTLHARIELFAKRKPDLAEKLMAIKWIGNAGSHADKVTHDDLLDAYDILCYVLDELYVARGKRIDALTRAINRRGAPRSRQRGSAR